MLESNGHMTSPLRGAASHFLLSEKKVTKESRPLAGGAGRSDFMAGAGFVVRSVASMRLLTLPVCLPAASQAKLDSWWRCMMAEVQALQAAAATGADGLVIETVLVSWWARWPLFERSAEQSWRGGPHLISVPNGFGLRSNPVQNNPAHPRRVHRAHHENTRVLCRGRQHR